MTEEFLKSDILILYASINLCFSFLILLMMEPSVTGLVGSGRSTVSDFIIDDTGIRTYISASSLTTFSESTRRHG
jgi:hypothetical protein